MEQIIIKKLGGENASELYKSCQNIMRDHIQGKKQIVVVSAMRSQEINTTDYLIKIGELLSHKNIDSTQVYKLWELVKDFHIDTGNKKLSQYGISIEEYIETYFCEFKENIEFYISHRKGRIIPDISNDYSIKTQEGKNFSILGFGEYVSSRILSKVICHIAKSESSINIDLSNIMYSSGVDVIKDDELFALLEKEIFQITEPTLQSGIIPVLGGYIGIMEGGINKAIGRGYSDATAAICVVSYAHNGYDGVLEIQKSVQGVLSADPRVLYKPESAKILREIDYMIAREITGDNGANAKLLHGQAIRKEVQDAGIKIHLFDPFLGNEKQGTWILPEVTGTSHEFFIGGRSNIVFFSISSGRMFQAGVLSNIFNIVKQYFSVDIISASETEVTFTIDGNTDIKEKLDMMSKQIRMTCEIYEDTDVEFVEYEIGKALIFCVGQCMRNQVGLLSRASSILSENNINIEIISQGRLQRAMVFGINNSDMQKAINVLHEEFIVSELP